MDFIQKVAVYSKYVSFIPKTCRSFRGILTGIYAGVNFELQ